MKRTTKNYIILSFILLAFSGLLFTFIITEVYQRIVLSEHSASAEHNTVEMATAALVEYEDAIREMANKSAQGNAVLDAFKSGNKSDMVKSLNDLFYQSAVSSGAVELLGTETYDKKWNLIESSNNGESAVTGIPDDVFNRLKNRKGKDKYKLETWLTHVGDLPVVSVVASVGGIRSKGFLVMHTSIIPAFKHMPELTKNPLVLKGISSDANLKAYMIDGVDFESIDQVDVSFPESAPIIKMTVGVDNSKLISLLNKVRYGLILGYLVVVSLISLIMLAVIKHKVFKPLTVTKTQVQKVANGELTTQKQTILLDDEIGEVADAVNNMNEKLYNMISSIRGSINTLSDITSGHAAISEEMTASFDSVAQNTEQSAQLTSEMDHIYTNSRVALEGIQSSSNEVASVIGEVSVSVQNLTTYAEQITGITQMVNDVSDQISLLALNAAIEAARAGEAGRGFAVVADEVKKLAAKTTGATAEINTKVNALLQAVNSTRTKAASVNDAVSQNRVKLNEMQDSMGQLMEATSTITVNVSEISDALSQQTSTMHETTRNVFQIQEIAEKLQVEASSFKLA